MTFLTTTNTPLPPVASASPTRALVVGTVSGFRALGSQPSTQCGHLSLRVEIAAEVRDGTWWYMVVHGGTPRFLFVFSSFSPRCFLGSFLWGALGSRYNDAKTRLGVVVARAIFVSVHVGLA